MTAVFEMTSCATATSEYVTNGLWTYGPLGATYTGTRYVNVATRVGPCVDLAVNTSVTPIAPQPGTDMTLRAVVTVGGGSAAGVPLTLALPTSNGFMFDAGAAGAISCAATGTATCPADLAYDPAINSAKGTIAAIRAGDSLIVTVLGKAGLVRGATYTFLATAPAGNDTAPLSNTSRSNYGIENSQVTVTAQVQLTGQAAPTALTFTGTLTCAVQGQIPVTISVPSGASSGQWQGSLWRQDRCSLALDPPPNAPANYTWGAYSANPLTTGELTADVRLTATVPLTYTSPTVPLRGTTWLDTDGDGIQNAGEVGAGGVTVTVRNSAGTVVPGAIATTSPTGGYTITGLAAGTAYHVTFSTLPTGYTCPTTGCTKTVTPTTNGAMVNLGLLRIVETQPDPSVTPPRETPSIPGVTPSVPGVTPSVPGATPSVPGVTPTTPSVTPTVPAATPTTSTNPTSGATNDGAGLPFTGTPVTLWVALLGGLLFLSVGVGTLAWSRRTR